MRVPPRVTIVEVGPRDGLQNEKAPIATADKIAFVDRLSEAGHSVIEVSAFVSPKWVPQMADAARGVCRHHAQAGRAIHRAGAQSRRPRARHRRGRHRGRDLRRGVGDLQPPQHQPVDRRVARHLRRWSATMRARRAFACAGICRRVSSVRSRARSRRRAWPTLPPGCSTSACSRWRSATPSAPRHPGDVLRVLGAVSARLPLQQIALHFHDTRGTALANVLAGLDYGVTTFDSSAGGLGGCPYAPGAAGNLATEDLLYMLNGLGIDTGVSIDARRVRIALHRDEARSRAAVALPASTSTLATETNFNCQLSTVNFVAEIRQGETGKVSPRGFKVGWVLRGSS